MALGGLVSVGWDGTSAALGLSLAHSWGEEDKVSVQRSGASDGSSMQRTSLKLFRMERPCQGIQTESSY